MRQNDGFTIIEVVVAMTIVLVGVVGLLRMADTANGVSIITQQRSQGNAIVRQVVEDARSFPYSEITDPDVVEARLKALPGLADDNTLDNLWTMKKKSTVYTIEIFSLCTVDDGLDGYGSHAATAPQFCSDSASTGTADSAPDDYKRLTVKLSWNDPRGRSHSIRQTTLINNPGAGAGPGVRQDFAMTAPPCGTPPPSTTQPPSNCIVKETSPETSKADFTLRTTVPARAVNWTNANVFRGNASPLGCTGATCSTWTFSWHLGCLDAADSRPVCSDPANGNARFPVTVDGNYLIGAQAFDELNNAGSPVSLTVTVNRRAPGPTPGFIAGWNGTRVEVEWLPQPDTDITKYEVYRVAGSADGPPGFGDDVKVCDVDSAARSCIDPLPAEAAGTSPEYYVVAYDLDDAGVQRAGARTPPHTAAWGNAPPSAPQNFACSPCTDTGTGPVHFTWSGAADSDGSVAFYRIYRSTSGATPSITDRYARTTGNQLTFEDTDTGSPRFYWVSAVDNNLAESAPTGPITAGG